MGQLWFPWLHDHLTHFSVWQCIHQITKERVLEGLVIAADVCLSNQVCAWTAFQLADTWIKWMLHQNILRKRFKPHTICESDRVGSIRGYLQFGLGGTSILVRTLCLHLLGSRFGEQNGINGTIKVKWASWSSSVTPNKVAERLSSLGSHWESTATDGLKWTS